jgi:hypothetical protein
VLSRSNRKGQKSGSLGITTEVLGDAPKGRNSKMGQVDKEGILTLQELMITALATADVVAKLLISKGLITKDEFDVKLFSERANYQALLQRLGGASADV